MRPLDATLGRRRVRAHDLDPELVQRATILGHTAATDAGTLVDVENGVLVAVKRHRFDLYSLYTLTGDVSLDKPRLKSYPSPIKE